MSPVLVIAGSDSSGGAGLACDVRTLARCGARALCAVTAVTAQSNSHLGAVHLIPPHIVRAQIAAALATARPGAIKIGMLGTEATVVAVAESIPPRDQVPVVLDPVLSASSGGSLLDAAGRRALKLTLLPRATLVTPNIPEAAALLDAEPATSEAELLQQGRAWLALGPQAVLLKGGHGDGPEAVDLLLSADRVLRFSAPRSAARRRGTGCALASAVAAGLAAGLELAEACSQAKRLVTELLQQRG